MNIAPTFEHLAKKYNLDLKRNDHNYLCHKTQLAYDFWCARQFEIDHLMQEVCDLTFAAKALQSVLDKQKAVAKGIA